MARPTKAQRLSEIHSAAMREFERVQSALREERLQCVQDRRFYTVAGAQWEGPLAEQWDARPKFEFNQVHLALIRIFNEYRNNRITVDFQAKDGAQDDDLADACDGLYRADEQVCSANEAYDNAFEEAVGGGYGAWRLRAVPEDEEDEDNERQRIAIEPIYDADSCVFFDLGAKRQDKSDATRCWVLTPYVLEDYTERFGDDPATWPKGIFQHEFDWCTPNFVWVAEYYVIEDAPEVVHYYRGAVEGMEDMEITGSQLESDPDLADELAATGFREVRQKTLKRKRVHKYLMSGGGILEDCGLIAGRHIPIVPVYGKRWVVDGIERCMGHVRLAKDAQRLVNSLMSWLADIASRFDAEKPILTPEQIAGHATMWAEDNIKRYPYLLINPSTDANGTVTAQAPAAYTKAPSVPPAMAALMGFAQQALQDLLGAQQAGEQLQPNQSGKAVELVQQRLDMQVFIYMSNMAKAMKRCGEIWLSMKRDIAVEEERPTKTVGADGNSGQVVLNQPGWDSEKGTEVLRLDISKANHDVVVDVGPSSTSQRSAVTRALTGIASIVTDPQTQQALILSVISNLEGEGLKPLREWAHTQCVKMGIIKPTDEEAQEMAQAQQNQAPDPQAEYLKASAAEANARAGTAQADQVLKRAQAEKAMADATATAAGVAQTDRQQAMDALQMLYSSISPSQQGGI
jgi:hypothetical protein